MRRLRFLGESSATEPAATSSIDLFAYLDERLDRLEEWFDAPLTLTPAATHTRLWVDTTTVALDRIFFGVDMGLRGAAPASVSI